MDPGAELGLSTELSVDRVREPGDRGQREHGLGAETPWSFVDDDETRSGQAQCKNTFEDHLHSPHREDEKNGPCSVRLFCDFCIFCAVVFSSLDKTLSSRRQQTFITER